MGGLGLSGFVIDDNCRCRAMWGAEECERGGCGRPVTDHLGISVLIDEFGLTAGVTNLVVAGDCRGGVSVMPAVNGDGVLEGRVLKAKPLSLEVRKEVAAAIKDSA